MKRGKIHRCVTDMWRCKECSLFCLTRYDLLKHLRLYHRHRQLHSCPYQNCPCNFKMQNALRILSKVHPKQTGLQTLQTSNQVSSSRSQELLEFKTFCCPLCNCSNISTERDFFTHIGIHFKSHETVTCMFGDCTKQISMQHFTPTRTGNTTPVH